MSEDIRTRILKQSIEHWNKSFCGISGLDLARELSESHDRIIPALEDMVSKGAGHLNSDVTLHTISLSVSDGRTASVGEFEEVKTHIIFPSPHVLEYHYYNSELVKEALPEYQVRLHKGGNQVGLVYFGKEVLQRYQQRPDIYEIYDTQAGGSILTKSEARDSQYVYVRYGKRLLKEGGIGVSVILKDLSDMAAEQQRYWHSWEIDEPTFEEVDPEFDTFIGWTYEGEWGESRNLIAELKKVLIDVNSEVGATLFKNQHNPFLNLPVLSTAKSLCDSCSELYKLIGPDNIDKKVLTKYLADHIGVSPKEFTHSTTKRELSSLQFLSLLEENVSNTHSLADAIREVAKYRIEADHKISEASNVNATKVMSSLLINVIDSFKGLCDALRARNDMIKERVDAQIAKLEEFLNFLSNERKAERELFIAKSFLNNLGVEYDSAEVETNPADPPDVIFQDARFEIKEILDPERRRTQEIKKELQRLKDTRQLGDLWQGEIRSIQPSGLAKLVGEILQNESNNYAPDFKANTDILFYYNRTEEWMMPGGSEPDVASLESLGWRSICVTSGACAYVVTASSNTPNFIADAKGVFIDNGRL